MRFARVVGTVVCTEKVPAWKGHRLLLLAPTDSRGNEQGRPFVAVDLVSAAPGQLVFYVKAREAGMALPDPDNPTDAAITGIVDSLTEAPLPAAAQAPPAGGR
ncbi:MAG TPA: EutN/CcmL family microcompartment protein [Candidatus Eisenbacteria bacterium]|jgi:microcompartment protein CcmK/EutM